jgi:hypothetical protein
MRHSTRRSLVKWTLLAIDYRVGGFLEIWYIGLYYRGLLRFVDVVGASVSCGRIAGIGRSVCLGGVLFSCPVLYVLRGRALSRRGRI